ncbi:hypothetical protein [Arenimonas alkanexedens]
MTVSKLSLRPLLFAALVVALVSQSGCAWTRSKLGVDAAYKNSQQGKPLEVPPGLDAPSMGTAVVVPDATGNGGLLVSDVPPSTLGGAAAPADDLPPSGVTGIPEFTLADSADNTWRRIGESLADIPGVTIADRAKLLNSYEVSYRRVVFLLRAEPAASGTRVVALGANGQPITTGAPAELLTLLREKLG